MQTNLLRALVALTLTTTLITPVMATNPKGEAFLKENARKKA
jgi:hypothetical protein